jgi:hypothetical protein
MIVRVAVFGAVMGLAGCAAGSRSGNAAEAPVTDTVTVAGIVRVVGADPVTQLVVQAGEGAPTALVGPLQVELHQMVGLEVRVAGVRAGAAPPATTSVDVHSYEAVALNGVPAHTGTLEQTGDDVRLVGTRQTWTLVDPPDEVRAAVGAKVWVAGEAAGDALRVTAYGIIKRASSP